MSTRQKILAGLMTILALIALSVSAYLTWVTFQSESVAGCTAGAAIDCDHVLGSRWSKWFGLPVSLFGAITYVAILALCWPAAARPGSIAMAILFAVALTAGGSAVWFVGLQAFHLKSFCLYCMTVHTCGLLVAILALLMLSGGEASTDYNQMRSLLGVAATDSEPEPTTNIGRLSGLRLISALAISALSLSALMGGQLLSEPETSTMEEIDLPLPMAEDTPAEEKPSIDQSPVEEIAEVDHSAAENEGEENPNENNADEQNIVASEDEDPEDEDLSQEEGEFKELLDLPSLAANAIGGDAQEEKPQTNTSNSGSRPRRVAFVGLQEKVDTRSMPIVGNPKAKYVIVEMMDYTCKHCRHLHPHLKAAVDRYGDQLAVIVQHVPLSKKCNPLARRDNPRTRNACDYAKLAIGVWKLDPKKFPEYHDWLLESEKPPSIYEARTRAIRLVGDEILLDSKVKADTGKRVAKQTAEHAKLRVGLPVLLLTNGALRGVPENEEQLFKFIEGKIDIQPQE